MGNQISTQSNSDPSSEGIQNTANQHQATDNQTGQPQEQASKSTFYVEIKSYNSSETRNQLSSTSPKSDSDFVIVSPKNVRNLANGIPADQIAMTSNDELDLKLLSLENLENLTNMSEVDQIKIARLADRTRNVQAICSIFKSQSKIAIPVALRAKWFFKGDSFRDPSAVDEFLNNVLKAANHHTVCRIIALYGKHLKNESLAEELFTKTLPAYKINVVVKLLPACGVTFLWCQIKKNKVILPCRQLISMYKKFPKDAEKYLLLLFETGLIKHSKQSYNKLFQLLPQQHPKMFLEIFDKYGENIKVKFGKTTTLSILKVGIEKVHQKPCTYLKILHIPTLRRHLKESEFESLILDSMPAEKDKFDFDAFRSTVLKAYKHSRKTEFMIKVYSAKYNGASVLERSDFSELEMVKHLPVEVRNNWALGRVGTLGKSVVMEEVSYLKFVSPDKSIPKLKELTKSTSDPEHKVTLLEIMIDCCQVNNDTDCLLAVMSYTVSTHNGEPENLHYRFLCRLKSAFQLHKLTAEHWKIINMILELPCIKKEQESRLNLVNCILEHNLRFCLDNNQPFDQIIDKLMKYDCGNINHLVGVPKHEFVVLKAFFEKYRVLIEENISDLKAIMDKINVLIISYKKRSDSAKRSVTECTWLMDVLNQLLKQNNLNDLKPILTLLRNDVKASKMFADSIFQQDPSEKNCLYYLKHDDRVIERNASHLRLTSKSSSKFVLRIEQCTQKNKQLKEAMILHEEEVSERRRCKGPSPGINININLNKNNVNVRNIVKPISDDEAKDGAKNESKDETKDKEKNGAKDGAKDEEKNGAKDGAKGKIGDEKMEGQHLPQGNGDGDIEKPKTDDPGVDEVGNTEGISGEKSGKRKVISLDEDDEGEGGVEDEMPQQDEGRDEDVEDKEEPKGDDVDGGFKIDYDVKNSNEESPEKTNNTKRKVFIDDDEEGEGEEVHYRKTESLRIQTENGEITSVYGKIERVRIESRRSTQLNSAKEDDTSGNVESVEDKENAWEKFGELERTVQTKRESVPQNLVEVEDVISKQVEKVEDQKVIDQECPWEKFGELERTKRESLPQTLVEVEDVISEQVETVEDQEVIDQDCPWKKFEEFENVVENSKAEKEIEPNIDELNDAKVKTENNGPEIDEGEDGDWSDCDSNEEKEGYEDKEEEYEDEEEEYEDEEEEEEEGEEEDGEEGDGEAVGYGEEEAVEYDEGEGEENCDE